MYVFLSELPPRPPVCVSAQAGEAVGRTVHSFASERIRAKCIITSRIFCPYFPKSFGVSKRDVGISYNRGHVGF